MYFVDTPVWIDFLRGRKVAHVAALTELLQGEETVGIALHRSSFRKYFKVRTRIGGSIHEAAMIA